MKEFRIKVKVTSEKELVIYANNVQEAALMGADICSDIARLKLSNSDVVKVEGEISGEETYSDCTETECYDCGYYCENCEACGIADDDFCPDEDCMVCDYLCPECMSCTFEESGKSLDTNTLDPMFEAYLRKLLKESAECANTLLGQE